MSKEKTTVTTEYGEYVPLSQRLPDFHREYPHSQGYCIEIEVRDPLSFKPGLLSLYKECAANGVSPDSIGLPRVPVGPELVFTAKLVKDGRVINSASSLSIISFEKDFARAETGARQRLVAACGFPGDPSDLEEAGLLGSGELPVDLGGSAPPSSDDEEDLETPFSDSEVDYDEPVNTVTPPATEASELPAHLQNQVDTICASLDANGTDYQKPSSKSEALKFIRSHRGGNGASP